MIFHTSYMHLVTWDVEDALIIQFDIFICQNKLFNIEEYKNIKLTG